VTLEARPASAEDRAILEALTVDETQRHFVGSNRKTFRQWPDEPGAEVFGLWDGETAVGLMACIDMRDRPDRSSSDDPETAYLWRLMVASGHQGKGYGRAALSLFERWAADRGLYRLEISIVPENTMARALYTSFGFRPTGRVVDGEDVLVRPAMAYPRQTP
jgi:diamine N-acetyltransferase